MHIAIDCRCVHPHMGGIGRAALDLVRALGREPRGHRITMIVSDRAGEVAVPGVYILPVAGAMIDESYDQLHLPSVLEELRADLYVNTTFSLPAVKTTRFQMSVVHDVVFEDKPEYVEPTLRAFLSKWSRFAASHADHVLTVSDHAKARICEVYGLDPARITRIYNGVNPAALGKADESEARRVRSKYSLEAPFILYLGSLEVKKGICELLKAYRVAVDAGLSEGLVLAGGGGGPRFDFEGLARSLELGDRVRFLGFVDEVDKLPLIRACELFVYPSLYEGFGLPPLEAMALGVPTIVSSETSLPEIVGDGALIGDVHDVGEFSRALRRGVGDQIFRRRAADAGPARASSFRWEDSAGQFLELAERMGEA